MSQLSIWTLAVLLFFLVLSWAPEARPVVPSPSLNDPAAKLIKERIRLEHPDGGGIQALAFSPDSSLLASANLRKLVLWDLALRKPRHVFGIDPTKLVTQLAFSTDGKTLITANIRPKVGKTNFAAVVTKWDVKTGVEKEVFFFEGSWANLAISANGQFLVTAHLSTSVAKVWDLKTKKAVATLEVGTPFQPKASVSGDGKIVAITRQGEIKVWELPSGKEKHLLKLPKPVEEDVEEVVVSRDGRYLAAMATQPKAVYHFWDLKSGQSLGPAKKMWGVRGEFTPNGNFFAVSLWKKRPNEDRTWVDFWSVPKQAFRTRRGMKEHLPTNKMVFSPDGKLLARGDAIIQILEVPKLD